MEKNLDELLRLALTPTQEPDSQLNQQIMNICENRQKGNTMDNRKMKRIPAVALTAALALGIGSLTVFAAQRYLLPERIAESNGDRKLAEAFSAENSIAVNETQTYGRYQVTLLGIVSGENISDLTNISDGEARLDRTYAVVAIEHADGSPMQEERDDFFVSPLIAGFPPAFYNAASMHGNYSEFISEGILYRFIECDNVEIFADRDLYLCVSDGSSFFRTDAYCYDQETGEISRNEEYPGLNALFHLPFNASKANPEKAAEYILSLGITVPDIPEEKLNGKLEENFAVEVTHGNEKGAEAAEYALQFVGNPYEWDGESLTDGCDCSGFTKGVFEYLGISLPHSASRQKEYGEEVSGLNCAQPGDLVFYENPSHVGIYIGDGNIVHAYPSYGICVSEADYAEIAMIRRIF